jgi:hypothetical protein
MGSRSKGRGREVSSFSYKPRMGVRPKLLRRLLRAIKRETYSRALETEFRARGAKRARRNARGKSKKPFQL